MKVTSAFGALTCPERVKVLILDDSVGKRSRSKSVELLARVYDHVEHKFQKGFTLLTLGWSDGYSFIPTGSNMLSSASKNNRYNEASDAIDRRTNGYKFRKESMTHKMDAAIHLIRNALNAGIKADYVLMDTWFTTEPMLGKILDTGIDAIGMVKQLKQRYTYYGRQGMNFLKRNTYGIRRWRNSCRVRGTHWKKQKTSAKKYKDKSSGIYGRNRTGNKQGQPESEMTDAGCYFIVVESEEGYGNKKTGECAGCLRDCRMAN
ncbi:MAG: hypothetical protein HFH49_13735 [Lachnospiraceae bacterium]|nr:hypothetical protein [Lachnospiraceae bacterium]